MKRVILTGASGFVGANLARRLLSEGHEVHFLLREKHSEWRIRTIANDVNIHIVDLNNFDSLDSVISLIHPDWIFHLAAYGAYSSQTNLNQMAETNLIATSNLVDVSAKHGFEAFINTGSSSEYGYKNHAPAEDECLEPNSAYAVTKAAGTHYCRFMAKTQNVNLATVRLYSVFGPFEEPTRFIPTLILEGLNGKLPPLVNPATARDYVFIEDVCSAYLSLASHPECISGEIYNLGSGRQLSIREVVDAACQQLPIKADPVWGGMPDRQWDTSFWMADHTKITKDVGWNPVYSFADGFKQTIEWFQSSPDIIDFYKNHRKLPA